MTQQKPSKRRGLAERLAELQKRRKNISRSTDDTESMSGTEKGLVRTFRKITSDLQDGNGKSIHAYNDASSELKELLKDHSQLAELLKSFEADDEDNSKSTA